MQNKKIGVGFIGAGWMGSTLIQRIIENDNTKLIALHQRSKSKAEETLKRLGVNSNLYNESYEEMLSNPNIDAVFICSPNSFHGRQSIKALRAGKHVFCEKPCATNYDEYLTQIRLAKENPELITYVNYLMNFDSLEQRILSMTNNNEFGEITQIQVNYRHPINIEGDKKWKLSAEIMGDAIGMGIIHSISVMLNIMEANGTQPSTVYATRSINNTRGFETEPIYNILINFDNGSTGFCFGNVDVANGYDAYHNIHGTKGGLIFDSYLPRAHKVRYWSESTTDGAWVSPLDTENCQEKFQWPKETTTPDSGDVVNHQTDACVQHFIDCIQNKKQSFLSFEHSSLTAGVGWAALRSCKSGKPETI